VIAVSAYVHFSTATLQTMKTQAEAEMSRQLVAGGNFSMPGGRSRGGVPFADLSNHLAAINYALGIADGSVITQTVADCSSPIP
jgi:hypothetical protein